jgi:GTPase Era involved in 16S rRNA processing
MSFFSSEVVRAEMTEITELQEEVYSNIFKFPTMTKEERLEHVELLERLLDKQKVLYTRMSLSDDPEAQMMKEKIVESAMMMGMPPGTDMNIILNNMSRMLEVMKEQIDKNDPD